MRCGKCKACQVVETSKKLLMPNPPFEHADQLTVETWNKVLRDNPCEEEEQPSRPQKAR